MPWICTLCPHRLRKIVDFTARYMRLACFLRTRDAIFVGFLTFILWGICRFLSHFVGLWVDKALGCGIVLLR
jgi:hypothetical protein